MKPWSVACAALAVCGALSGCGEDYDGGGRQSTLPGKETTTEDDAGAEPEEPPDDADAGDF